MDARLDRTRSELADFLRRHRERISPLQAGLPLGKRRRTPGLRREEVAILAGVGLTWYTWLEQGRDINVSAAFLDNIAGVFKLDEIERRHLFLLAGHRMPPVSSRRSHGLTPFIRRLLDDLGARPAHVLNLCWDVVGWNAASDALFGFSERDTSEQNMLWMLFSDDTVSSRMEDWDRQAPKILASFRRDYARALDDPEMVALVQRLSDTSPRFRELWRCHDVRGECRGRRSFVRDGTGTVVYEHATFLVDEDQQLRLVVYGAVSDADPSLVSG